jgi:hypothetical protein
MECTRKAKRISPFPCISNVEAYLIDPRTGNVLSSAVVLIEGNKIKQVGSVPMPRAPVLDTHMSYIGVGHGDPPSLLPAQGLQEEDKAAELIDYAKTLYDQQDERLKRRFPLAKPLSNQAALKLEFANGSRLMGVPKRRGSDPLLPSRWSADG